MAPEKTDISGCPAETSSTSPVTTEPEIAASGPTNGVADVSTVSVDSTNGDHDPYYEPVISLPEVEIKTLEEDEEEMYKGRCKMFRFVNDEEEGGEWKERGTGNVKLLKNEEKGMVRLLMRQEKTLKVRANHYITPYMKLRPNCGSDRAFVWYVMFDFADEESKGEMFAIKFANADNARVFKDAFEEAATYVTSTIVADCQDLAETLAAVKQDALDEEEEGDEEDSSDEQQTDTSKQPPSVSSTTSPAAAVDDEVTESLGKLTVEEEKTTGETS